MSETLELTLDNRLEAIAPAVERIDAFCRANGANGREVGQLSLVLDELLTNIISYAWPQGGEHSIALRVWVAADGVGAELVDDGMAFDPRDAPQADLTASLEDREVGGLGVHFAMTLMDSVDYRRSEGKNRLTVFKTITPTERSRD